MLRSVVFFLPSFEYHLYSFQIHQDFAPPYIFIVCNFPKLILSFHLRSPFTTTTTTTVSIIREIFSLPLFLSLFPRIYTGVRNTHSPTLPSLIPFIRSLNSANCRLAFLLSWVERRSFAWPLFVACPLAQAHFPYLPGFLAYAF